MSRQVQVKLGCLYILLWAITSTAYAQVYTFKETTAPYKPLTQFQKLNPTHALESFEEVDIGFPFRFFDKTYTSLQVFGGMLAFTPTSGDYDILLPFSPDALVDMNRLVPGSSEVNYARTGTPGSQVFTLEYKLAGIKIENAIVGYATFQVRLYEKNGDIEYHYGTHYVNPGIPVRQEIGLYRFGSAIKGIGLSGTPEEVLITGRIIDDFPFPMNGILAEGTIYRFSYDRNLVWNNLGAIGWELINEKTTSSGLPNMGFIRSEIGGALLGHNKYKDLEFAEKYYLSEKAVIKGMVTQNYGATHSGDSASFSIYSVAPYGLPGQLLLQQKKPYHCLDLNGKLNFIAFDNTLSVSDTFFVAFGLSPYTRVNRDTIGLNYIIADHDLPDNFRYGRVAVRWFNHQWYDVYSNKVFTNRTGATFIEDNFGTSNDLIHLAVFPVVNFNLDNQALIEGNLNCKPSGNKKEAPAAITENFVEHNHLKLHPNFPNPASTHTYINVTLTEASPLRIQVYDMKGKIVLQQQQALQAGFHQVLLNTSALPSGIYTYVLQTDKSLLSAKLVIHP